MVTVKDMFRELVGLRKAIERTYGFSPELETFKAVGLGWKNCYKYSPVIYMNSELPIPLPKRFIRDYSILGIDMGQLRVALNKVAKYAALDIAWKQLLRGKVRRSEFRNG